MVVGGAVTRLYMPERLTQGLNILVQQTDAALVRRHLQAAGYHDTGELTIGGSSWTLADGWSVDVLECREPWGASAITAAQTNRDGQGLPVLPLEYLVLMKFQAGRVQDLANITRMLGQASTFQLPGVRCVFATWLPDDVVDVESLIMLGQLGMGNAPSDDTPV